MKAIILARPDDKEPDAALHERGCLGNRMQANTNLILSNSTDRGQ